MGTVTAIEWTDHTFNGWMGCTKVGPGCDNCYAEDLGTSRLGLTWGLGAPRRRTVDANWNKPRAWNRKAAKLGTRPFVFCSSLADVFDNEVDPAWRTDLFQLIRETPHLVWLLLTKRPQNIRKMVEAAGGLPDNVALGTTVVTKAECRHISHLLAQPGALFYFVSAEPLLEDIADELEPWLGQTMDPDFNPGAAIGWVIVGGESGPRARPMATAWALRIQGSCMKTGAVFNFKQNGGRGSDKGGHELLGRLYLDRPVVHPIMVCGYCRVELEGGPDAMRAHICSHH